MTTLSLLVLRCANIEKSKLFYEKIGLKFEEEKHNSGPVHYSSENNSFIIELYPSKKAENDNVRLGFEIGNIVDVKTKLEIAEELKYNNRNIWVAIDPDGRKIELYEYGS